MSDVEPHQGGISAEIASNVTNEVVKTLAVLYGVDQISAAAFGGAAGGAVKTAFTNALNRRYQRVTAAVEEATRVSGCPLEELLTLALEDDRKIELLVRALEAAQKTVDERRVRFYGRIAAKGVLADDDARVDSAQRIFASLAALDAVDLKVMLHMVKEADRKWTRNGESSLGSELPEVGAVLDSALSRLESQGLISSNGDSTFFGSTAAWWVTKYGELCIRELLEPMHRSGDGADPATR